ncbi:MAG: hypothetical protein ACMUIP_10810 [bacterium]
MKARKRIGFAVILIKTFIMIFLYTHMASAQLWALPLPYDASLSLWSPFAFPVNPITGLQFPSSTTAFPVPSPVDLISRSAFIVTGGGAATIPAILATSWTGSWTSFIVNNSFGPMSLSLIEDLATGTFTGTVLFSLNSLVPVGVSVSGAYTGVGLSISLSGIYSDIVAVTIGGGPLPTVVLVPVNYLITLDFSIIGGTTISGLYSIASTQKSDSGSFNLTRI